MNDEQYFTTEEYKQKLNRMIFPRDKLDEIVKAKIKEVNDEAGYRTYLEVPEMIEIVASAIEEMMHTLHCKKCEVTQKELEECRDLLEHSRELYADAINDLTD